MWQIVQVTVLGLFCAGCGSNYFSRMANESSDESLPSVTRSNLDETALLCARELAVSTAGFTISDDGISPACAQSGKHMYLRLENKSSNSNLHIVDSLDGVTSEIGVINGAHSELLSFHKVGLHVIQSREDPTVSAILHVTEIIGL